MNKIKILTSYKIFILIILNLQATSNSVNKCYNQNIKKTAENKNNLKKTMIKKITIFVHGTTPLEYPIYNPSIVKNFFLCPAGLKKVSDIEENLHPKKLATIISDSDPEIFPIETFYLFGWSGKLSFTERKKVAQELYKQVRELLKKYDEETQLTFISHSHGGNILLHLAEEKDPLEIDRLILFACPVQKKTKDLVHSQCFKKVYSIHSHTDIIQIIDPQGFKELREMLNNGVSNISVKKIYDSKNLLQPKAFFSHRHFEPAPNLYQIKVAFAKRGLMHIDFLLPRFLKQLPKIIKKTDQQKNDLKKEIKLILE